MTEKEHSWTSFFAGAMVFIMLIVIGITSGRYVYCGSNLDTAKNTTMIDSQKKSDDCNSKQKTLIKNVADARLSLSQAQATIADTNSKIIDLQSQLASRQPVSATPTSLPSPVTTTTIKETMINIGNNNNVCSDPYFIGN